MENGNRERKMEEGRRKWKFWIESYLHTVLTSVVKETVTSRWICSLISETHSLSHCWYRSRPGPVR
jgi:fructose-1,6-bisphosphatase